MTQTLFDFALAGFFGLGFGCLVILLLSAMRHQRKAGGNA